MEIQISKSALEARINDAKVLADLNQPLIGKLAANKIRLDTKQKLLDISAEQLKRYGQIKAKGLPLPLGSEALAYVTYNKQRNELLKLQKQRYTLLQQAEAYEPPIAGVGGLGMAPAPAPAAGAGAGIATLQGKIKGLDIRIATAKKLLGIQQQHNGNPTRTAELLQQITDFEKDKQTLLSALAVLPK